MRIALTTPMKPPDSPTPSGDRQMARAVLAALEATGARVRLPSRFTCWRAEPDTTLTQAAVVELSEIIADPKRHGTPQAVVCYHLYHKAPDYIGYGIAQHFDIPYVVVEASRAPKQAGGKWAAGYKATERMLARADQIGALTRADKQCLATVIAPDRLYQMRPFADLTSFLSCKRQRSHDGGAPTRLLCVAMMREGAKLASYNVLMRALSLLPEEAAERFTLSIVGDGPARAVVEAMVPEGLTAHTRFFGEVLAADMPAIYAAHDLLVWPAVKEAFGLCFLEAQASGLAVIGGASFGVPDVVYNGQSGLLCPQEDAAALAQALLQLLNDPQRRQSMGDKARELMLAHHNLVAGGQQLKEMLSKAVLFHTRKGHRNDLPHSVHHGGHT
ncbi:glycosyltransferase family 4 protein [Polycladidibacter hongkongensis]|uniref:glycosyltransferase family 4 protein n=1 Tax=Polycladidibacter hongkongensis TaxID=1647556 RepID=UPI000832BE7F|nr:glycosyltransferase family 4 protein [Pseudovibrio hongkongensis]